jgi:hypothetical protein
VYIGAALSAVALLSSCRVDQSISLDVKPNGTGKVTVVVTADKDIVTKVPSLAQDIRTDDVKKAGWTVEGPTKTKSGGLTIQLTHDFDTPAEATAILSQVSETRGPLHELVLARSGKDTNSTWSLSGRLEVNGGLNSFIDDAGLELLDVSPYAAEVAEAGLDLGDAVGISLLRLCLEMLMPQPESKKTKPLLGKYPWTAHVLMLRPPLRMLRLVPASPASVARCCWHCSHCGLWEL